MIHNDKFQDPIIRLGLHTIVQKYNQNQLTNIYTIVFNMTRIIITNVLWLKFDKI